MITIFADTYSKGCKIYDIKEKKLNMVFSDDSFRYPENKEELKAECLELLRKKGLLYAVYFKKKLIGLYTLRCENLDLILTHELTYNMEDIVRAEVEKTIKLLVHMTLVNKKYDRAFWHEEIIDKDYVTSENTYWYLWLPVFCLTLVLLILNIVKQEHWLVILCYSLGLAIYLIMFILSLSKILKKKKIGKKK